MVDFVSLMTDRTGGLLQTDWFDDIKGINVDLYKKVGFMGAPSNVQNIVCTKMALQLLNIQSLNIQNLECTTPWMYKHLNVQKLECTNLICTKPWMYKSHLYKALNEQISKLVFFYMKYVTYPDIQTDIQTDIRAYITKYWDNWS